MMYCRGHGVAQNYQEAVKYFQQAADGGFADAQFNLAVMYEHGIGVNQDYQKAFEYYQAAANHGDTNAQEKIVKLTEILGTNIAN